MTATALDLRSLTQDELVTGLAAAGQQDYQSWFEQLQTRIAKKVRRWFLDRGASMVDADDLSQDFWINVIQFRDSFRPGSDSESWLESVAANTSRNRFKYNNRKKRRPEGELREIGEDSDSNCAFDNGRSPLDTLIDSERDAKLHTQINRLPAVYRETVRLYYFEGLSHAEIASRLNIPIGTSTCRLQRAVRALREGLHLPEEKVECTRLASEFSEATEYVAL